MGLLKKAKDMLYKIDFFYTAQLLRYKEQPEYRTLFGGVISFSIIIALIVIFYNMVIMTINRYEISYSTSNTQASDPPPIYMIVGSEFMFGVEIWHHNLNEGLRYFDVTLKNKVFATGEQTSQTIQFPLVPCSLDHWSPFPQTAAAYNRLNMDYWLCPQIGQQFTLQGKYASQISKTLEVAVKKCSNLTNQRPCANQTQIDQFFADNGNFFFTIYFINPLLNPSSNNYMSYYLEDNNYIIFTKNFGSEAILFMEDYTITSDNSILPITDIKEESGGLVSSFALKNPYQVQGDTYCSFAFFKSSLSKSYERSFKKLDDVVSYIGGLMGAITMALFVLQVYNGFSFEITLAGNMYRNGETNDTTFKKYNFLSFLAHGFYAFLDIVSIKPKWEKIKQYYECREEMVRQLDVLFLFKRILLLEKSVSVIFSESQIKALHFQRKPTLDEAKRNRKRYKVSLRYKQQSSQSFIKSKTDMDLSQQQKSGEPSLQKQIKKLKELTMNQNSSDSSDEDDQDILSIFRSLLNIRRQANEGNRLSQKLWEGLDESVKMVFKDVEQNFQLSKRQIEDTPKLQTEQNYKEQAKQKRKPFELKPIRIQNNRRFFEEDEVANTTNQLEISPKKTDQIFQNFKEKSIQGRKMKKRKRSQSFLYNSDKWGIFKVDTDHHKDEMNQFQ